MKRISLESLYRGVGSWLKPSKKHTPNNDRKKGSKWNIRRADLLSSIVLLSFGIALLFVIIPYQVELDEEVFLSPRLVPNLCAIIIIALSILLLIGNLKQTKREAKKDDVPPISVAEFKALIIMLVIISTCIFLFIIAGAFIASTTLIVGLMLANGERRPLFLIAIPGSLLLGSYFLFYHLLGTAIK